MRETSLVDFAAWRGRDSFVSALVGAGADPTEGVVSTATLGRLPRPYVAWLARAAARLRQRGLAGAGTTTTCACGELARLVFSPCGHHCCQACPWRAFQGFGFGQLPELRCPDCSIGFEDPALNFTGQRRGIVRHGPLSTGMRCVTCGCLNAREWYNCINCSRSVSQLPCAQRKGDAGDFYCLQLFFPRRLTTHWTRAWQRRQTQRKWRSLPEEMPQTAEERLELQAALEASKPQYGGHSSASRCLDLSVLLPKAARWFLSHTTWGPEASEASEAPITAKSKAKRLAGAFRALGPVEVARERLGATRSNRSERFRAAAEVGDLRRVQALLEAGVDIDSPNEYGQTPLFLAAFEGHLQVVEAGVCLCRFQVPTMPSDLVLCLAATAGLGRRSWEAVSRWRAS